MSRRSRPRRGWTLLAVLLAACSSQLAANASTTSTTSTSTGVASSTASSAGRTGSSVAPSTSLDASSRLLSCVQAWPVRQRIAMMVWPAVYSDQWAQAEATVRDLHVGGVLLMKPGNTFVRSLATHLHDLAVLGPHGVLVATDEEGGAVQRLSALGVLPSQQTMSSMSLVALRSLIEQHARVIAAAGIDVVLGPVVDVRPVTGKDPLGQGRLFLGGPNDVAARAQVVVQAWESAGLLPVLKHFPGHGSASADSHTALAVTPPLSVLRTRDLVPYQRLVGSGAGVMVGHLSVPGLTDGAPASLSPAAISLLRGELGYGDALVMTDALGMAGVGADVPTAAVRAVVAGVDVVIFTATSQTGPVIDAIAAAVADGRIPIARIDQSAARVANVLAAHGWPCT